MALSRKIDFAVVFGVKNANPNGDPLNSNRPRTNYEGLGEVSDVCLKRKIRDRLQENGHEIFVQSEDKKKDDAPHLRARAEKVLGEKMNKDQTIETACSKWFDVRAFGQLFAYAAKSKNKSKSKSKSKSTEESKEEDTGISIAIRGPVSIHSAFTPTPVSITSTQITKSVSGDESKKAKKGKKDEEDEEWKEGEKSSDTMGMKHRVDSGVYVFYGSMNPQLAEKTGFSDQDAMALKEVLPRLFENDASSARPEGSMRVEKVFWWQHNCKSGQYSSAKVHGTVSLNSDGTYKENRLPDLPPEIIDGF